MEGTSRRVGHQLHPGPVVGFDTERTKDTKVAEKHYNGCGDSAG
jgi:hypothetical protein